MNRVKIGLVISALVAVGCGYRAIESNALQPPQFNRASSTPNNNELKDKYVREEGWQIPVVPASDLKSSSVREGETVSGVAVTITASPYVPEDLFTTEPFATIGDAKYGTIKINLITELTVKKRIFGYVMLAARTVKSSESNKLIRSGLGFTFRYLDTDGDGKFETLVFGGPTDKVPDWVAK